MTSMKKKFLGLFLGWRLDTSPQVIAAYGWAGVFLALLAFGGFWWFYEGCMISIGQLEESLDIHIDSDKEFFYQTVVLIFHAGVKTAWSGLALFLDFWHKPVWIWVVAAVALIAIVWLACEYMVCSADVNDDAD
jgi:hypothetical protein